ncbi:MAG: phosphatase PAP2 family protein [Clostridia bacterium]|nr:phosphatase PAP2 family protein [Clostridia bacterium]
MKKSKIIAIAALAVIFVTVFTLMLTGALSGIEPATGKPLLHTLLNPNAEMSEFMHHFTIFGDTILDVFIIAVLVFVPVTTKQVGIPVAATAIASTVLNKVIKAIVDRPRPEADFRLLEIGSPSFPSGHAMNNAAIYIAIMMCLLPLCKTKWQKGIVIAIFTLIPLVIGITRVYFNVHYASDVVCGWCLGAIVALVMTELVKPGLTNFSKLKKGA